jgi:hypothetical protein
MALTRERFIEQVRHLVWGSLPAALTEAIEGGAHLPHTLLVRMDHDRCRADGARWPEPSVSLMVLSGLVEGRTARESLAIYRDQQVGLIGLFSPS